MSDWILVPCLVKLRSEFNALSPNRDKGADGSIGDSSHTSSSDHTPDEDSDVLRDHDGDSKNEVHALDIDSSGPWPGTSFETIMRNLIARERAEWLSANTVGRLKYIIWNRRIYTQGNDFRGEAYSGADSHTNHAHFSARYTTAQENDTRPWGVEGDDMPLTSAEISDIADAVWAKALGTASTTNRFGTGKGASDFLLYAAIYGFDAQRAVATNATAEAQRDAATAATLAGMQSAMSAMASASGALTPADVATLTAQVRAAAEAAGAEATAVVSAKLDALREHLGDDAPVG